jgi:hypothetical protein
VTVKKFFFAEIAILVLIQPSQAFEPSVPSCPALQGTYTCKTASAPLHAGETAQIEVTPSLQLSGDQAFLQYKVPFFKIWREGYVSAPIVANNRFYKDSSTHYAAKVSAICFSEKLMQMSAIVPRPEGELQLLYSLVFDPASDVLMVREHSVSPQVDQSVSYLCNRIAR